MLSFHDNGDGYYQFSDDAPPLWYAHLIPCPAQTPPEPTVQQKRDAIQIQIDTLEHTQLMPRITREALLLLAVQTGASMGLTEPQIYSANIGYHKLRDFDNTIVALRAQKDSIT